MLKMPEMYVTKKEFIKFIHTHIKEATNGGKIKPYITILVLKIHLKFIIIN